MAAPQGPVTVDESSSLTGIDSRAGSLSPERFLLPSPVFPPHLPLPAHSEILGLAQTELGTDEALLIGEGADSTGRLPALWNDESAVMGATAAR